MSAAGRRRAPPSPKTRDKIRRSKLGSKNPMWKGDEVTEGTVRWRLRRDVSVFKDHDRHHIDGNGMNSDPSNILVLTRREHMIEDGRMFRRDEFGRFISAEEGGV